MEALGRVLARKYPNSNRNQTVGSTEFDFIANERRRAEIFNAAQGTLTGYDCPDCKNRGYWATALDNGALLHRPCRCMTIREAMAAMKKSGLPENTLEGCTFDQWQTPERWQEEALNMAKQYVSRWKGPGGPSWFVMAGRPGCGKTMLCTAVFRAILEQGVRGRYVSWRDFARETKAAANDRERFSALVGMARSTPLLYLDDFWKGNITPADVNLAFELLNDRYASGKPTIISSEHTIESIIRGDEAIGSRLYERSKGFYLDLSRAKNWRLMTSERAGV